jgi:hypothetical protein
MHPATGEYLSPPLGGGALATFAPFDAVQVSGEVGGHCRNGNALRLVQIAEVDAIVQQLKYA